MSDSGVTAGGKALDHDWNINAAPWIPGLSVYSEPSPFQLLVDIGDYVPDQSLEYCHREW